MTETRRHAAVDQHARQLANEQAADSDYFDALQAKLQRRAVSGHRNTWTAAAAGAPSVPPAGGLLGRVALRRYDEDVNGSDFYIGSRHIEERGLTVFSWTARVACTFFRGRPEHRLFDDVAVTRSLLRRGAEIVDFADDALVADPPQQPFSGRALQVPEAPTSAVTRRRPRLTLDEGTVASSEPARVPGHDAQTPKGDLSNRSSAQTPVPVPPIRAESALRAAVAAPRVHRLGSVLSTLQPDQYDYVTRTHEKPLVIQGHPGTGKTIVAAHRAAYLVHPDTPAADRRRRVLIVGPTDHYVSHIAGVLSDLVPEVSGVRAVALPGLLRQILDVGFEMDQSQPLRHEDVDWRLGSFADAAARALRRGGLLPEAMRRRRATELVYEALRMNDAGGTRLTSDPEWVEYLGSLPPVGRATKMRRFLPLLAQCSWSTGRRPDLQADHVIVDEAQDVSPLEWRLLDALNRQGSWTLLGDMNQRRSDWTYHSWLHLGVDLGLADANANGDDAVRVETASLGYRTTSAIMQFAGKLLPRTERGVNSLQTIGDPPSVVRASSSRLQQAAVAEALRLAHVHEGGSVAVIAVNRRPLVREFRRSGFTMAGPESRTLTRNGRSVSVLDAEEARGLEFDAVVVVEPAEFPKNLGRHGLLYTSLTRANRQLAVVHALPLPDALRRHARR